MKGYLEMYLMMKIRELQEAGEKVTILEENQLYDILDSIN
jgi:hypothetical protein